MNNQKKITLLQKELDEVKHILLKYDDLAETSIIEVDLMKDKLRTVYDALCGIDQEVEAEVKNSSQQKEAMAEQKEVPEEKTPPGFEQNDSDDSQPANTPEENLNEGADENTNDEAESSASQEMTDNQKEATGTLADRYKQNGQFMNESFAEKRQSQKDISNKIQNKPIEDLNKALGVNDRFQLTRDLFHGNRAKFTETIEALNSTNSFEEAENLVAENFQWDMQNPNVKMLMDLLRRKHS